MVAYIDCHRVMLAPACMRDPPSAWMYNLYVRPTAGTCWHKNGVRSGASPDEVLGRAKRMGEQVVKAQQRTASRRAVIQQSRLRRHKKCAHWPLYHV